MMLAARINCLLCACLCQAAWASDISRQQTIVVITSGQRPVSGLEQLKASPVAPNIQVHNLNAIAVVKKRLSGELPTDPQAHAVIKERIALYGQFKLEEEIKLAYQAQIIAIQHNIKQYPAIIFDNQAVIYGVTDLISATAKQADIVLNLVGFVIYRIPLLL